MASPREQARRVVERLRGDEALTRALADDAATALLAWAEAAITAYASQAPGAAAVEDYGRVVRDVVQAAATAAEAGRVADPAALLAFLPAPHAEQLAQVARAPLGDDPDENALRLVRFLTAALPPAPAAPRRRRPRR